METFGYLIGFLVLIGFACWGCVWEIKRMKQAIAEDKKRISLYEALLLKLEEY